MFSRGLLIAGNGAGAGGDQTIGEAGQMGFGVGCYGGDPSDLDAMGLTPMDGCEDPSNENYGNYMHTNGSIMCFIPAFAYRVGNRAAPSYARDGANALEIADATNFSGYEAGASFSGNASLGDGWILHRAFVDGGLVKRGFFIDKYLCSKSASNTNVAVSVKNGDPIELSTSYNNSSAMTGCEGRLYDAMLLGYNRGEGYSCCSCFQWAAISMLGLAHAQASTSADNCAWYDGTNTKNYPRGNNNSLKDYDDSTVTFTQAGSNAVSGLAKTGSASNFAKTTHNGQNCGITDVAGNIRQTLVGWENPSNGTEWLLKTSIAVRSITKSNYNTSSNYDIWTSSGSSDGTYYWGANAFFTETSGNKWASCGLRPKTLQSSGTSTFGKDSFYFNYSSSGRTLCGGGYWAEGASAGLWFRYGDGVWSRSYGVYSYGFRASGYAG